MVTDPVRNGNLQKIIHMGIFPGIVVDIEGMNTMKDFEVITIVDDTNTYLALLRFYCDFYTDAIINLNNSKTVFEQCDLRGP